MKDAKRCKMKDLAEVIGVHVQPSVTPLGGQILRIWRVRSAANGQIRVEAAVANTDWTGFSGWRKGVEKLQRGVR